MKYLQKGPFTVAVGGGDNYDRTFGRRCFYCKKVIPEESNDFVVGAHQECIKRYETDTQPTLDQIQKSPEVPETSESSPGDSPDRTPYTADK